MNDQGNGSIDYLKLFLRYLLRKDANNIPWKVLKEDKSEFTIKCKDGNSIKNSFNGNDFEIISIGAIIRESYY